MLRLALLALLVPLAACGPAEPPAAGAGAPASAPASPSINGASAALCAEHGVLEAVCPKCNPKLAPIFQGKGDWCREHGFPESFCPLCHPERGGRPALALTPVAQGGASDGPADGTIVQLAGPDVAELVGIETEAARAVDARAELVVLGTIAYDATRQAEVNARAGGVVKELCVELGARVEAGAVLARVESAQVGADRSRLVAGRVRVETAQAAFERQSSLAEKELATRRSLDEARFELQAARAEVTVLEAALEPLGADPARGGVYDVTAPLAGVVVRRSATLGQRLEAGAALFELVDPSSVWAELDVPEASLARVRPGLEVVVTSDSLPGQEFRGTIDHVAPEIDVHTRTAKARVHLANPGGRLRANQFVQGRIAVERLGARVLVPRSAVQRARSVELVFVEQAVGLYVARRVRTGAVAGDAVELAGGVAPGERVVTRGSFLLKTETLKGAIGAGCCAAE